MTTHPHVFARRLFEVACFALFLSAAGATAQVPTTITHQGRLFESGKPPTGTYDMQFKLYDTAVVGTGILQGSPNTIAMATVNVTNGIFTVQLDFGASAFPGANRFLEISVRHPGDPAYTTLAPRTQLSAAPYAIMSLKAANNVLKSGDTMTGQLVLSGDPSLALGATTKQYVDNGAALKLNLSGGAMTGTLNLGNNKITSLAAPTNGTDAANKSYVDAALNVPANYVFAYDTSNQTTAPQPNAFKSITFDTNAQLNGWTHIAGASAFTCNQTGLYLIGYTASVIVLGTTDQITLKAILNGADVPRSHATLRKSVLVEFTPVSKSFLASVTAGDLLALQFAQSLGGTSTGALLAGPSPIPAPSISITIIRIQ